MATIGIGDAISRLRKERGITQESLACAVGVTSQAVSKWESGGAPDVSLLPAIADYFHVSVDFLFSRGTVVSSKLEKEVESAISCLPRDQRFAKAFEFCWALERGLMGKITGDIESETPVQIADRYEGKKPYSQMIFDEGITTMSLCRDLWYFVIMPEPDDGWSRRLGYRDEFADMFKLLGDPDTLRALYHLYGRNSKPFTPNLLEKALGIGHQKAEEITANLVRHRLLLESTIELDDEEMAVYTFTENPAFIALLAMCEELVEKPTWFHCFSGGRGEPFLR